MCVRNCQPIFEALGFNADLRQLLMAETEVYGLISGSSWLRQSLVAQFEEMGYRRNPYDKCIMTLPRQASDGALRLGKSQGKDGDLFATHISMRVSF